MALVFSRTNYHIYNIHIHIYIPSYNVLLSALEHIHTWVCVYVFFWRVRDDYVAFANNARGQTKTLSTRHISHSHYTKIINVSLPTTSAAARVHLLLRAQ